ncbi:SAM-dependent methyltransferase [Bailinhaonella thermotolerans]|uniref:Class I SAM-dependent methyltransferase n=1 Tax=Bailinhaonella thermotolerans TaxID=1070861 RepID=A0A3A4A9R6_9ACTN|nr:class I SAM-dependent methyltransferase [Bailinhaonella thermotolerans]RJL24779.1 class I SAM-dependent methyltransferase [Bailinhaonella thermotolerans]
MDRTLISSIAHGDHPIAAPVSEDNLDRLLLRCELPEHARVLDLGCGQGAWSLQALDLYPAARADCVDVSEPALETLEAAAAELGFADRVLTHRVPAADFPVGSPYDLVMSVGATHAFGGLAATLAGMRPHVARDGVAIIGDGFWERPPTPEALAALGAEPGDFPDLAGVVAIAEEAGWAPVYGHVSDRAEWDDYEWSWTGTLTRWALDNPGPEADEALAAARRHRAEWLRGYRDVLGFVCLVLRKS